MTDIFYGTAYLAEHIGSTQSSVSNWAKVQEPGFPEASVVILSMNNGISARGWTALQLTDARDWMTRRLRLDEDQAVAHWDRVDQKREERHWNRDPTGPVQEKLF